MIRPSALVCFALLAAACQTMPQSPGSQPGLATANANTSVSPLTVGVRLLSANQPEMALDAFNRSVTEEGVSADALTGIGASYLRLGQRSQALQFLEAATALDPNSALARNNLGVALYDEGDYVRALTEFNRAYALTDGLDASIATNVGIAEAALAETGEAIPGVDEVQFDVIQYGHGVYRLEPRTAEPPTTLAERTK